MLKTAIGYAAICGIAINAIVFHSGEVTPEQDIRRFGVVDLGNYSGGSGTPSRSGGSGREVDITNLIDIQHFLVNVRDGAEVGLCRDPNNGGVRSVRSRPNANSDWNGLGNYAAPDCEPGEDNITISESDIYRAAVRLLVHPGGPKLQPPPGSHALVNAPAIVFVDPAPQQVQANLNGINVHIRATPIIFEWDFGDGSTPLTTRDPGHAYPNQTVYCEHPRPGEYTITLTTAWHGQWSINNNTWQEFPSYVVTTTNAGTLNVNSAKARLVTDPTK